MKTTNERIKKNYKKPEVTKVKLTPEEVVLNASPCNQQMGKSIEPSSDSYGRYEQDTLV